MEPIPTKVHDVKVYPFIGAPVEVPSVFVDGKGTYAVGSLTTHLFYNLDLAAGKSQHGGVHAGNRYYAIGTGEDGKSFETPWMTCTRGGDAPQFARTIDALGGGSEAEAAASQPSHSDIAYQIHLKDVFVQLAHDPREPIVIPLIENGKAIATFAGLLPGGSWSVAVAGGNRVNPLQVGARVTIGGRRIDTGKPFAVPAVLTTRNAGDPAYFVQLGPIG